MSSPDLGLEVGQLLLSLISLLSSGLDLFFNLLLAGHEVKVL